LETRLKSESLEPLTGFLAFLVPKLWQNNQNLDTNSFWVILPKVRFFKICWQHLSYATQKFRIQVPHQVQIQYSRPMVGKMSKNLHKELIFFFLWK